ncbi:hypothetical protein, partial [Streptomyces zhihengii]|uniref:hypothetical protein n=1 Tax=Streptomyces zhihengii TaxID=1818004 RepID=UPI0033B7E6EB
MMSIRASKRQCRTARGLVDDLGFDNFAGLQVGRVLAGVEAAVQAFGELRQVDDGIALACKDVVEAVDLDGDDGILAVVLAVPALEVPCACAPLGRGAPLDGLGDDLARDGAAELPRGDDAAVGGAATPRCAGVSVPSVPAPPRRSPTDLLAVQGRERQAPDREGGGQGGGAA